jgi:xanthosine utilization system XapX-like protein
MLMTKPNRTRARAPRAVAIVGVLGVLVSWSLVAQAAHTATLKATLVDAAKKAEAKTATVQVTVGGLKLMDPDKTHGQVKKGQGHLHYQLDNGPVIATTAPKLSFHGLSRGQHTLVVMLAGNNHEPLGPQEVLTFEIP